MKRFSLLTVLVIFSMVLGACGGDANANQGNTADNAAPQEEPAIEEPAVEEPAAEEPAAEEPVTEEPEPELYTWAAPAPEEPDFPQRPPTEAEIAAGEIFANRIYPETDWYLESFTHGVADQIYSSDPQEEAVPTRALGNIDSFWIIDSDKNTAAQVDMKLLGVSEHAYFYFDLDREPDPEKIEAAKIAFEEIYPIIHEYFGEQDPLGIDGDPHIFILHPAATKLCDVDESKAHNCTTGGYFWPVHQAPSGVIEISFEHEAIMINYDGYVLGGGGYESVLAHEFQHLVDYWYDKNQGQTWENEGASMLAMMFTGFEENVLYRANAFLAEPDVQFNTWSNNNYTPHYGRGLLFHTYIFDRFGKDFYKIWHQYPVGDLVGLGQALQDQGIDTTGEQVWFDWLVSLALIGQDNLPEQYSYDYTPELSDYLLTLDPLNTKLLAGLPRTVEDSVHQYGSDFYRIKSETAVTVNFSGSTLVPLLTTMPPSGNQYWYSGRVLGLNKLTLAADLTNVDSATLQFSTYYKLEKIWDYGYVVVSTDGGETWQGLVSENMIGDEERHDPYHLAYTDRFFTGIPKGAQWSDENIDLSAYAGQEILIRFEANNDTGAPGFAVDNVAIPEIGFYDDMESENPAWETDTWVRTTGYIPQKFTLVVITFADGQPVVKQIEVTGENLASFDITGFSADNNIAYVIVTAQAPQTEATVMYRLDIAEK